MTTYTEYKNSGSQWLGNIPSSWETGVIGSLYALRNTKVSDEDYPPLSVTMRGVLPQLDKVAKTDAHDARKLVLKGDFAINSRSDRRGSCGISDYDGSVSLINTVLVPRGKMNPQYYNWLFHTVQFADEYYRNGHGIVDDLWTTRWDEMKRIVIPVPPEPEQAVIAGFLKMKVGAIDTIISEAKASIEEYKAWKASIIYEAVTKGLDPNADMKESGNPWIGKIPLGWRVCKTLFVLSMPITDGPHTTPDLFDEGVPFVSAEAVSCGNGLIDFDHIRGYISEDFYQECCLKYIPKKNDIYMIKSGATTGRVSYVDTDIKFTIWSPLAVFRANEKIMHFKYLFYFLQSDAYQKQVELGWTYGTQQNIGMRTLETLKLCLPPKSTQIQIADYLDEKCGVIDSLIQEKTDLIRDLEGYRKSLIFEVVTGKRRVF